MVDKAIALAIHNSFDRSSKLLAGLTADTLSHEGIRQKIAAKAETVTGTTNIAEKTVLVDSTKVKAGNKERGSSVQIAITAEPGPMVSGRPTIRKQLVHLHVGDVETLRDRFSILQPERLVHDGDVDFSLHANQVQRCRWHLVHQLKHYLWQDGIPHEERGAYQRRLKDIIFGERLTAPKLFSDFIKDLEAEGCLTSAEHLQNARHETFTYRADNNFAYTTTTPLEREMRELNRRADVGVRWSDKGIENVLKVLFHYRLNTSKLKEPERVLLN